MKTTIELQTATEQMIALALSDGLNVFECNDQFYIGCTQEEFNAYELSLCEDEEYESREDIDARLISWIDENMYILLEDEMSVCSYDSNIIEYQGAEYLVVNEDEANSLWEASLDIYLEDCVYPELSGNLAAYFDDEKWKRDARTDGRGHILSTYDGNEDNETVNNTQYCIFRVN